MSRDRFRVLLAATVVLLIAAALAVSRLAARPDEESRQPAGDGSASAAPSTSTASAPAPSAPVPATGSPAELDVPFTRSTDPIGDADDRAGRDIADVETGVSATALAVGVRFAGPVATPATLLVDIDGDGQLATGCNVNLSVGYEAELAVNIVTATATVRICGSTATRPLIELGGTVRVDGRFVAVTVPFTAIPQITTTMRVAARSTSLRGAIPRYWDSAPGNGTPGFLVTVPAADLP